MHLLEIAHEFAWNQQSFSDIYVVQFLNILYVYQICKLQYE